MTQPRDEQELADLLEKATAGPWRLYSGRLRAQFPLRIVEVQSQRGAVVPWTGFDGSDCPKAERRANAKLMVAAKNLAPELLRRLAALRSEAEAREAEIARLRAVLERIAVADSQWAESLTTGGGYVKRGPCAQIARAALTDSKEAE